MLPRLDKEIKGGGGGGGGEEHLNTMSHCCYNFNLTALHTLADSVLEHIHREGPRMN